jgi:NAD+ kinase
MGKEFQSVAILGRFEDPRVAEPMAALAAHLAQAGVEVLALPGFAANAQVRTLDESEIAAHADLVVTIGGDGSMLYAAGLAHEHGVPLLGINRGRLGFLADVTPDEMLPSLEQVLAGEYSRESRLLLEAHIVAPDGTVTSSAALNDIVLQRRETGRMIDFETRIAGHFVNSHSGDGLIVATPTGSTAYALSCGGPIIEPGLDAVVVVPVCPHTLSDRPIVIPSRHEIEVTVLAQDDVRADVTADGRNMGGLEPSERLLIREAPYRITLIHPPGYDYYEILRSKLHWGRDGRSRTGAEP